MKCALMLKKPVDAAGCAIDAILSYCATYPGKRTGIQRRIKSIGVIMTRAKAKARIEANNETSIC